MDDCSGNLGSAPSVDDDQVVRFLLGPRHAEEVRSRTVRRDRPRTGGEHRRGDPLLTGPRTADESGDPWMEVFELAAAQ